MAQQHHTYKALSLFTDTNTYRTLNTDPTTKLRNQLINTLKDIKQTGGPNDSIYKKVYPSSAVTKFYGLPKIHKVSTPSRPIVSSRGSITCGVAKVLAGIIHPFIGQSPHHLKNTQHFVEHIKQVRLEAGEVITSFDVKALFTSVPVDTNSAANVITGPHTNPKDQHVHPNK